MEVEKWTPRPGELCTCIRTVHVTGWCQETKKQRNDVTRIQKTTVRFRKMLNQTECNVEMMPPGVSGGWELRRIPFAWLKPLETPALSPYSKIEHLFSE
jgi:hypothetical protein